MHIWSHWVKTYKIGVHYAGEVEAFNPSMVREGSGLSIVITSGSNRYIVRILKQKRSEHATIQRTQVAFLSFTMPYTFSEIANIVHCGLASVQNI